MSKEILLSNLKNAVVGLEKLLKVKEKKYNACKQNMDNMQSEIVKSLFPKETYELALNKCNLLIDLFKEKVAINSSVQELEQCLKSGKPYKCISRLDNLETKITEMARSMQEIDSVNKLVKKSSLQEDVHNAATFLKPYCQYSQYISPNDPNYDAVMEFCGKGVDDASL